MSDEINKARDKLELAFWSLFQHLVSEPALLDGPHMKRHIHLALNCVDDYAAAAAAAENGRLREALKDTAQELEECINQFLTEGRLLGWRLRMANAAQKALANARAALGDEP